VAVFELVFVKGGNRHGDVLFLAAGIGKAEIDELDFVFLDHLHHVLRGGRVPGAIEIEWMLYPGNEPNAHFLAHFKRQVDPEALVMFLCRSGARSNAAATLAAGSGFTNAYNILEGFEGDKDAGGHRNKVGGWRHANLPWTQG
jgi:rhodanese-related sulfurtransferase